MKSLLISIKPIWCAKIMNGDKNIEVRKNKALANAIQKLIDENGYADIYVYCSKSEGKYKEDKLYSDTCPIINDTSYFTAIYISHKQPLNGKVVFKFRCYKVEEISWQIGLYELDQQGFSDFLDKCCLGFFQLKNYLNKKNGYAIHISDLKIFDEPKELSEFESVDKKKNCRTCKKHCRYYLSTDTLSGKPNSGCTQYKRLTKAPQNMIYIEVENNE